jgi:hypothetical protein
LLTACPKHFLRTRREITEAIFLPQAEGIVVQVASWLLIEDKQE